MNVEGVIEDLIETLIKDKNYFKYKDILIVGENNSGKSKIIKEIIKRLKDEDNFKNKLYFIDSPNRKILTERTGFSDFSKLKLEEIVDARVQNKNFNKKDVFTDSYGSEVILNEIIEHFDDYLELFKKVLDINLSIEKFNYELNQNGVSESLNITDDKDGTKIYLDEEELDIVSDARQSMIRILMEINFAFKQGCKCILIDEFDMNLDYINAGKFIEKLKDIYPGIRFIITAHSIYTILGANDIDVIKIVKGYEKIEDNECILFDGNDLDNIEIIDKKIFVRAFKENTTDTILSEMLKNCILQKDVDLNNLDINKLSFRQKVVYDFISERISK